MSTRGRRGGIEMVGTFLDALLCLVQSYVYCNVWYNSQYIVMFGTILSVFKLQFSMFGAILNTLQCLEQSSVQCQILFEYDSTLISYSTKAHI